MTGTALHLSVLETEVTTLVTAMRRSNVQWGKSNPGSLDPSLPASLTSQNPALLAPFLALKSTLNSNDAEQVSSEVSCTFNHLSLLKY